ncbi:hypothetical protein KU6B_00950 [Mameliella alba]|uniref:SH3 domain-containing protein n=1 Tax=Mameliella alba TaxID=561184 RepID=UPI0013E4F5C6|nr:SH3 domain-containing protein [Mameliella alba]BBU53830.1 hypothetical protein KU6B_00950 [Mameliella alba]
MTSALRLLLLAVFCFHVLTGTRPASAATITRGGDAVMGCRFSISGQIEEGDADALRALLDQIGFTADYSPVGRRICLESPGGGLREALAMADLIGERAYGTAVPAGAACESACAVIFLAGRYRHPEAGGAHSNDRLLHPRGRLGFHAPSLLLGERAYTRDEVDTAYAIALDSMAGVLRHRADMGTAIPDSLFLALLGTPPFEMTYVETVGQAAQWEIAVAPVAFPADNAQQALSNLCWHVDSGLIDYPLQSEPRPLDFTYEEIEDTSVYALSNRRFRYEGSARCELRIFGDYGPVRYMGGASYTGGATDQDISGQAFPYMLYPPDTPIADLPVWTEGDDAHVRAFFRAVQDPGSAGGAVGGFNNCRLASTSARVINVNEFVNLRAAPGLRAPIVGQVRLADRVQVPDTGRLLPLRDSERGQECLNFCRALTEYPSSEDVRRRAEGCIAENMLWYQVVAPDGNTGFVSRHFLAE